MKSVYAKILAWAFLTLLVSMLLFFLISRRIEMSLGTGDVYQHLQTLVMVETGDAFEAGGTGSAAKVVERWDRIMGWRHHVLDSHGRELATGADRSDLITQLDGRWEKPVRIQSGLLFGTRNPDGKYMLIMEAPFSFEPWTLVNYYGLILLTIALLCWPLAFHIGAPLRSLARTVDRFGQGDFTVRAKSSRKDEIGALSRSFDRMADRIETLLTAERRLLQDVSHELRSPLARLSFAAELVKSEPDTDKAVARLRKEISRLSDLIGALIEMTRAEGDPAASRRREFRLDELIGNLVEDCSVEAESRSCSIAFESASSVPMTGDPELVRRAIENVLRNAIRYSPETSAVNVHLEKDSETIRVEIRDRGTGVPEEQLSQIFRPFFRVDDSRNDSTGGIGLGLAIATRAVSLHQGWINARNADPGLLVTIGFPLAS
jgi:two-component system sensor histidine kinase CpxA